MESNLGTGRRTLSPGATGCWQNQVTARLETAVTPGTGQTMRDVVQVMLDEWRTWLTGVGADHVVRDLPSPKEICTRMVELIDTSREFRDRLLADDPRDAMRRVVRDWTWRRVQRLHPGLVSDRTFPRYLTGVSD